VPVKSRKFLPEGFGTPAVVGIMGDRVVISTAPEGQLGAVDQDTTFTVIKNGQIADAFRTWFKLLWEASSVLSRKKKKKNP